MSTYTQRNVRNWIIVKSLLQNPYTDYRTAEVGITEQQLYLTYLDNSILLVGEKPTHDCPCDSITLTDLRLVILYGKAGLNGGNWKPNLESRLAHLTMTTQGTLV